MTLTASANAAAPTDTAFVQFWNEVLAPKFIRFKHMTLLERRGRAVDEGEA
jgi:hypothetical protein